MRARAWAAIVVGLALVLACLLAPRASHAARASGSAICAEHAEAPSVDLSVPAAPSLAAPTEHDFVLGDAARPHVLHATSAIYLRVCVLRL